MPPQAVFINNTFETIKNKTSLSRAADPKAAARKLLYYHKQRVLKIANNPIILPDTKSPAEIPTYPRQGFKKIPETHARIEHPNKTQPPLIIPTIQGLKEFPTLLKYLQELGRFYGAVKLKLPTMLEGKEWNHISKPLSQINLAVRKQVFEELPYTTSYGGKAYTVASLPGKLPMSRWQTQMVGKKMDYQLIGTMEEFWEKIAKEVESSKNKASSQVRNYGVDTEVSLINMDKSWTPIFDDPDWNLLLTPGLPVIPGITTPYVYFGTPGTAFSWHVEDYHCYSANTVLDGAEKIWHVIPGHSMQLFVAESKATVDLDITSCPQTLRHQGFVLSQPPITPELWSQYGYACHQFIQEKNEMIIVWPGAYHSGINSGWNLAEAMNFATEDWIPEAKKYQPCNCDISPTEPIILDLELIEKYLEDKKQEEDNQKAMKKEKKADKGKGKEKA